MKENFSISDGQQAVIDEIRDFLRKDPRILAAYVYGSYGTDTFRSDSDVDIALLLRPGEEIDSVERVRKAGELSATTGYPVDIGILSTRNMIYFSEVIAKGECLFSRDKQLQNRLVTTALSLYLTLRDDRREVEEAYRAT